MHTERSEVEEEEESSELRPISLKLAAFSSTAFKLSLCNDEDGQRSGDKKALE
jgi:hypothetical protein